MPLKGSHIGLVAGAGLSKQVEDLVTQCATCAKDRPTPKEPLMPASFPSRPWERIATDLYEIKRRVYIIVVDYYSRWFEIKRLHDEISESIIKALKELFATHGIPEGEDGEVEMGGLITGGLISWGLRKGIKTNV